MGVAICCIEYIESERRAAYTGDTGLRWPGIEQLDAVFRNVSRIVTFGGGDDTESGFDFCVLEGDGLVVPREKGFDIRLAIKRATGGQLPKGLTLDRLAQVNLGIGKTGSGEDAPTLWGRGEYEAVAEYCEWDTSLTADLYRLWCDRGYLLLPDDPNGGGRIVGSPDDGEFRWERSNEKKSDVRKTDSRATVDGDSRHRRAGDGARVPEPQFAAAEHAAGQGVGDSGTVGDAGPHVAQSPNVLPFARPAKATTSLKSTNATRGTKPAPHVAPGRWQVDYVRASENTYAFRLRWAEGRKRGTPLYIKRVAATVFQSIRKGNYETFKQQLIASHSESSLHASHAAG